MKAIILAGGLGTRISEETDIRPKPMVEIGGKPILWHIMKIYSSYGINDFIVCCGYKGYVIKEFFANYFLHTSNVTFDLSNNSLEYHESNAEPWRVTLVDTGDSTMTGGRLLRVKRYLSKGEAFCLTYGDGLADINISKLLDFHNSHGKIITLTAATPPGRFGALEIVNSGIKRFIEKPAGSEGRINGGFFVCNSEVFNYIDGDETVLEREPLEKLAEESELMAFEHNGFWQPMDTLRDKIYLSDLWTSGSPPWKIW
ncbi:glucose-1-phosphate cytidylyltransferase [Polynucleobacter sp. UK-Kesae-W10]|uniref:glucose-1-phosphate cytidylyltransferase n=1 Tax=Polynucleobacter sp. UK-Kesae-W10 TaxID=1819738 RepID=UPI001C0B08C2|nr:glucose-1-phosphate cytidylyltransferase [Polynucleobacter sp. UK-Kesae-W10]MBU3576954.1 glucose-1-phosphate cytidylyltransferase [Polynucleobacter sp. UK-Kesae-W10]